LYEEEGRQPCAPNMADIEGIEYMQKRQKSKAKEKVDEPSRLHQIFIGGAQHKLLHLFK
jgi:hypothetical protein